MEKVYISDDSLNNLLRARKFELEGKWWEARKLRQFEGYQQDVQAIDMILESTRLGDEYRTLTKGAFEDLENRKINLYEFHNILNQAHKEVYG
jgi:hypothetical protein